jgi:penicillin-binding protein 1A
VSRTFRYIAWFTAIVVVGACALGGTLALAVPAGREMVFGTTAYGSVLPKVTKPAQRSIVYDRYGNPIDVFFSEDRSPVDLKDVPQTLIDAVLAIEDRNFYEHNGVDVKALGRAVVDNLSAGEVQQGGSTITQQLVKNTLIKDPKRQLRRKIQEAFLATRLEKELTKKQILRQYLNVIYLGNGAYGVRAAAERYFGKEPKALTLAESALIAGLIQAPEQLNPITNPKRARARRALVLDGMVTLHKITEGQARFAKSRPLPTEARSPLARGNDANSHFLEEVKKRLLHDDPNVRGDVGELLGADDQARYDAVFRGGLRIHTTFDPFQQNRAQAAIDENMPDTPVTAALVAIDNSNGGVVAMVGGRSFEQSKFNLATQGVRQTGSAFKGITLATALDAGYSPDDSVSGGSLRWPLPGEDWELSCSGGTMRLWDAVAKSNNCAFGRIAISLGPGNNGSDGARRVIDMAGRLGIDKNRLSAVPSITLGTSPTSVLEMASAYSVFPNYGMRRRPMFVTKVEARDGRVLFEDAGSGEPALNPEIAKTEIEMLKGVIDHGTATSADINRPAAGKTGTTNDNADAWFCGFTAQYTAAVWVGHPDGQIPMNQFGLSNVTGGKLPAPIWADFMAGATEGLPALDFELPNEALWPSSQYIDESGRKLRTYVAPATTVPPATTPAATTPPASTPRETKPPKTSPPASQPPNSQPTRDSALGRE